MLRKFVLGSAAAAFIAVAGIVSGTAPASAGVHVSVGIPGFFGFWAPGYYAPAPRYYRPYGYYRPQARYRPRYYAPRYYAPRYRPRYYAPRYNAPRYYARPYSHRYGNNWRGGRYGQR